MTQKMYLIWLLFGCFLPNFLQANEDLLKDYNACIEQQEYTKALLNLNKTLRFNRKLSPEQRGMLLKTRADFYENQVGDYKSALRSCKDLQKFAKAAGDNTKNALKIATLEKLVQRYEVLEELTEQLKKPGGDKDDLIENLSEIAENEPSFSHLVYHKLGEYYQFHGRYYRAWKFFEQAASRKPALHFLFQSKKMAEESRKRWIYCTLSTSATAMIVVLLLIFIPLFYCSKPWQTLNFRAVVPLIGVIFIWLVFFYFMTISVGESVDLEKVKNGADIASAMPGAGMSELLEVLKIYGIIGCIGAFLISRGLFFVKKMPIRLLFNSVCSAMLFFALVTIFTLRYAGKELVMENSTASGWLGGHYRLLTQNPSPYVISDPKSFPGLDIDGLDEKEKKEFLWFHYKKLGAERKHEK